MMISVIGALQGLPDAYSAGGLYSNKWDEDKNNLNLAYNYNRLGTTMKPPH
jgi:hypothetical protein